MPQTPEGRIAATVLMLLGIGLFSAITAIVTSFLLESGSQSRSVRERLVELDELRRDGFLSDEEHAETRLRILNQL